MGVTHMRRKGLVTALPAPATVLALTFSGGSSPAAADPPPVVDGTTQLGACDSREAVSFTPKQKTASFVCIGPGESTDFATEDGICNGWHERSSNGGDSPVRS